MKFVKRTVLCGFLTNYVSHGWVFKRGQLGHSCTIAAENGDNSIFAGLLLSLQVPSHVHDLLPAAYARSTLNWHHMFTQDTSELKRGSVALFLPALSFLVWEMGVVEGMASPGRTQQGETDLF